MAESVKINQHSKCQTCNLAPPPDQVVSCFICKDVFHGYCEGTTRDGNLATKSMVKAFCADSTKGNFKFFCDPCLTNFEKDLVETEKQKVACLEKKVESMETKLDKIMYLLEKPPAPLPPTPTPSVFDSAWDDKQRLGNVVNTLQNNKLVIKADANDERNRVTRAHVEKTIMEQKIPVQSYNNKNGDLIVLCENTNNRDELKESVASKGKEILMSTPTPGGGHTVSPGHL